MSSSHGFQQQSFSGLSPLKGQAGRNGPWINGKPGAGPMQAGQSGLVVGPHDQNRWNGGGPHKRGVGGCGGLHGLLRAPPGWKHHSNDVRIGMDLEGESGDKKPARKKQSDGIQPRRPSQGRTVNALLPPHARQIIGTKLTARKNDDLQPRMPKNSANKINSCIEGAETAQVARVDLMRAAALLKLPRG
jgi:hypothetical protein